MYSTKIVWHDPQIYNSENSRYTAQYLTPMQYQVFATVSQTVEFLSATNDKWVLVTSGRNGEELIQQVHDNQNVVGIVIFCMDKNKHKQWSSRFSKVKRVETRSFRNVVEHARKIWDKLVTSHIIELVQGENIIYQQINDLIVNPAQLSSKSEVYNTEEEAFYHKESELEMGFLQMCRLTLKNETIPRQAVLKELKDCGICDNAKVKIEELFNRYPNDLLRSFVYVYTTNYVHKRLNVYYAKKQYSMVMNITAACISELKSRPELMLQSPTTLWRGANVPEENLQNFKVGDKGFWPAFTSASIRREVAGRPAFQRNVLFEIHLQEDEPHPHICAAPWSAFSTESEVLLLPYFPLVITNIQKIDNATTLIVVEQDSAHPSLAINSQTLINYWRSRVERDIINPIDMLCAEINSRVTKFFSLFEYFSQDSSLDNPTSKFAEDFEEIIRANYKKHEQEIQELNNSARGSLLGYLNIMKSDLVNSIVSYIKEMIKQAFEFQFKKTKNYIIEIMSYEAIMVFNVPDELIGGLVTKVVSLASKHSFSAISTLKKAWHEEFKGEADPYIYINAFTKEMVKAIGSGVHSYMPEIEVNDAEIKRELVMQLGELKNKIHQSLENVLF